MAECKITISCECDDPTEPTGLFRKPPNVVGDGVADDTVALQAALDIGDVYLPNSVYIVSSTVNVRDQGTFQGESREHCIIRAVDVVGPVISMPENEDKQTVSTFRMDGTGDLAMSLRNNTFVKVSNIRITGAFTDGFKFERTWGSHFSDLWTFGSTITGFCFYFGENFNANVVTNIYSSNVCENNVLIENVGAASGHGCVFNGVTCQRGDVGLNIKGWRGGGLTINGLYTEETGVPIILGETDTVHALTINGAFLNGPSVSHRYFNQRGAHIQINNAHDVTITSAILDSYRTSGAGSDEFLDGVYYHTCSNITLQGLATKVPSDIEEWKVLKRLEGALTNSSIHILSSGPYAHSFLYMKARANPNVSYVMHLNQNGDWISTQHIPEIGTFPPAIPTS